MVRENKFKVVICDLDGTLLNNEHKISPYTKAVFQELYRQNYTLIVATGRHHLDALPVIETVGVPIYLVTSNGARIHSPEKELLFSFDISNESIQSILSLEIDSEITIVLFKEHFWLTNKHNEKLNSFQTELNYVPQIVDFKTVEDLTAIKLLFVDENNHKLIALKDDILINHSDNFSYAFSLPICLEIMDKSVDKSIAIAKILERENLTYDEAICFGDGFNDEKMLLAAAKGLIMGNAVESFKEKLSHLEIIAINNEDGVAKYLSKEIIRQEFHV